MRPSDCYAGVFYAIVLGIYVLLFDNVMHTDTMGFGYTWEYLLNGRKLRKALLNEAHSFMKLKYNLMF